MVNNNIKQITIKCPKCGCRALFVEQQSQNQKGIMIIAKCVSCSLPFVIMGGLID